jgi:hypothetical protein
MRAGGDKKLRKSLVKHGKETYDSLFSKKVVTQSFLKTYQDIIGR